MFNFKSRSIKNPVAAEIEDLAISNYPVVGVYSAAEFEEKRAKGEINPGEIAIVQNNLDNSINHCVYATDGTISYIKDSYDETIDEYIEIRDRADEKGMLNWSAKLLFNNLCKSYPKKSHDFTTLLQMYNNDYILAVQAIMAGLNINEEME